ncbi:MAG: asparagine synthase C-terminal domain-containing protein, partial [bacterium]|nr:asparagine synthase C-terminal domain-containing protein [bacterium]
ESYGDEVILVESSIKDRVREIEESLSFSEFPIWNPSAVAYRTMYRAIHERGYRVVIEGHGSDEQLGGYPHLIDAAWKELVLRGRLKNAYEAFKVYQETLNPALGQEGASGESSVRLASRMAAEFLLTILRKARRPSRHPLSLQGALDKDFGHRILPIVLRAFDRLSMSASVESRSPFMDYRLVEFTRALPTDFKVGAIGSKAFLREILKKYGKDYIYADKRKIGFSSDLAKLFGDPAVKAFLREGIERFDDSTFAELKKDALRDLDSPEVSWSNSTSIWKAASLGITASLYGIGTKS